MDWRKISNGEKTWDEVFGEAVKKPVLSLVFYGQGAGFDCNIAHLAVGEIVQKWDRGRPGEGSNWRMNDSLVFSDSQDGKMQYSIFPPSGDGFFCPAGFEVFEEFSFRKLEKTLKLMGYNLQSRRSAKEVVKVFLRCKYAIGKGQSISEILNSSMF